MAYQAPAADMLFTLRHASGFAKAQAEGLYDLGDDLVDAVLEEAGRFATDVIAPLNRDGDRHGTPFKDGEVTTPPGWKEAYRDWAAAGWNGLAGPDRMGRPGPAARRQRRLHRDVELRLDGVRDRPDAHHGRGRMRSPPTASEELKATYLPKLVSGEWMGTMQLTEPQAGSDVGALRTSAERAADGSYRITGQQDLHHLRRARPHRQHHPFRARAGGRRAAGHQGASRCSWCRNSWSTPDGTLGARNDVRAHSLEHKLGIHGSPTCTMVYGDHGGAVGYLVGEENRGMACMFTMMNEARLAVGLQGVAIAEARHPAGARLRAANASKAAPPAWTRRRRCRSSPIPT